MATLSIFQWHYFDLQLLPVQAQAIFIANTIIQIVQVIYISRLCIRIHFNSGMQNKQFNTRHTTLFLSPINSSPVQLMLIIFSIKNGCM